MESTGDHLKTFNAQIQDLLDNPPELKSGPALAYDVNERCGGCGGYIHNEAEANGPFCRCDGALRRCRQYVADADPQGVMTFENIDSADDTLRAAIADVKRVVAGESTGVAMFGKPGLGKSHVAVAACRAALADRIPAGYYNVASLVSRIQSTYSGDGYESRESIIAGVSSREIIVLDDLGKEHRSENVESIIYELVDSIYRAGRKLIVCSNLTPEQYKRYDEAVRSRIAGMCEIHTVGGKDWRRT